MNSFGTTLARGLLVAAFAIGFLAATETSVAATSGQEAAVTTPRVQAPHGAYAGTATCLTCHEDKGAALTQGPHSHSFRAGTPTAPSGCQACHGETKAALGCEACHGPGKAHVDGNGDKTKIRRFASLSPKEASDTCVSCHFRTEHTFWAGSQHDQRNVGCTTCHSIHDAKGDKQLKTETEADLCVSCHRSIVNKQMKFNHMPVREDKLSCSSCHNVHGASNVKLLRVGGSISESCYSCHAEKRGPMLWEHAPVTENCATCHDPHGSNNDRMLVAKQPFLCQRCHVTSRHPPTVYDGFMLSTPATSAYNANKIYGRSCVVCHQQIHGSNAPSGKAFLR